MTIFILARGDNARDTANMLPTFDLFRIGRRCCFYLALKLYRLTLCGIEMVRIITDFDVAERALKYS
jgi:hypothetical protein